MLKMKWKMQQGKEDRMSSDRLSVYEAVRYTKIHIRYNVLISGKLRKLATFLVPEAPYIATCVVTCIYNSIHNIFIISKTVPIRHYN